MIFVVAGGVGWLGLGDGPVALFPPHAAAVATATRMTARRPARIRTSTGPLGRFLRGAPIEAALGRWRRVAGDNFVIVTSAEF
jgi:hypothetical protein